MSILGHDTILSELESGNILIDPFEPANVNGASVDLRLGYHFWLESDNPKLDRLDTRTEDHGWMGPLKTTRSGVLIPPGGFMLACTLERAGTLTPDLQWFIGARSSSMRWGLQVCACAGQGDPGFASHITLELKNLRSRPLIIHPGDRICQIRFERVEGNGYVYDRHYGQDWTPGHMLPKALTDRR